MPPIHELPAGYREVRHWVVTDPSTLLALNVAAIVGTVISIVLVVLWNIVVIQARGSQPDTLSWTAFGAWITILIVFPLHEWIHGVMIRFYGFRPRYGARYIEFSRSIKLPYLLYATTDNALFTRGQFIVIALAPLVVISVIGLALIFPASNTLALYISVGVIFNASGAVGDVWMTWLVLRYPPDILVRDEADAIRIYQPTGSSSSAGRR